VEAWTQFEPCDSTFPLCLFAISTPRSPHKCLAFAAFALSCCTASCSTLLFLFNPSSTLLNSTANSAHHQLRSRLTVIYDAPLSSTDPYHVNPNTFMSYAEVCTEHAEHLLPAASVTTVFMQVSICSCRMVFLQVLLLLLLWVFTRWTLHGIFLCSNKKCLDSQIFQHQTYLHIVDEFCSQMSL
jgi:hypothetical protein